MAVYQSAFQDSDLSGLTSTSTGGKPAKHASGILFVGTFDATLDALSSVTVAADKLIYATGVDTFATTDLTAFGRSLIDDANAAAARTTLGVGRPGVHFPIARVDGFSVYMTPAFTNTDTRTLTANTLYRVPLYVPVAKTISEIAISVSTAAAGASIRLGIRNYNDATGEFTTLVSDCGTVDASTTGLKSITGLSITLNPGLYFLECVSNGSPNVASSATASNVISLGANYLSASAVYPIGWVSRAFTYAALPADETGVSSGTGTINIMPIIGVR